MLRYVCIVAPVRGLLKDFRRKNLQEYGPRILADYGGRSLLPSFAGVYYNAYMSEKLKRSLGLRATFGLANLAVKGLAKVAGATLNVALGAKDEMLRRSHLHDIQIIMFGRDIVEGEQGLPPLRPQVCPPGSPELDRFKKSCSWLITHNALPDYARRFARARNITLQS